MKDNSPSIGGSNPRSGSEPALPFATMKYPLRSPSFEWVLVPESDETPERIKEHRYVAGLSRIDGRAIIAIIDATMHLLVAHHLIATSWAGQVERIRQINQQWGLEIVGVDHVGGGEQFAQNLRAFGVSAARQDTTRHILNRLSWYLCEALRGGELVVYPDPVLLEMLRRIDYEMDNRTGHMRLTGQIYDFNLALLAAVAIAWQYASTPRYVFGLLPE